VLNEVARTFGLETSIDENLDDENARESFAHATRDNKKQ